MFKRDKEIIKKVSLLNHLYQEKTIQSVLGRSGVFRYHTGERMQSATSTLRRHRRDFAAERSDFYSRHEKRGLIEEINSAIVAREPFPIASLRPYLLMGNERILEIICAHEREYGRLPDPVLGSANYKRAIKECVDSRPLMLTVLDLIELLTIHERTAAAIVRKGHIFRVLNVGGKGYVLGHSECGGEKAAHDFHKGSYVGKDVDPVIMDHVIQIALGVPPAVALISDPRIRNIENARHQARMGDVVLKTGTAPILGQIHPLGYTLPEGTNTADVSWLAGLDKGDDPNLDTFRETAKTMWAIAADLKRTSGKQYAHTAAVYDPYRLGRYNDVRSMVDALPHEVFAVTANFKRIMDGRRCNALALGSVEYAVSHGNGGHVSGIGGDNGTRHIMIVDPDPRVLHAVKAQMLDDSAPLKDFTKNGETFTLARYDLETRAYDFIQ